MEVDLSKLEAGQTVRFRAGGGAVVKEIQVSDDDCAILEFAETPIVVSIFDLSGRKASVRSEMPIIDTTQVKEVFWVAIEHETPFDIIEIIPKPFDWDDVKPGMAFIHLKKVEDGNSSEESIVQRLIIFECWSVFKNSDGGRVGLYSGKSPSPEFTATREHENYLTRAPEHDIEVQS